MNGCFFSAKNVIWASLPTLPCNVQRNKTSHITLFGHVLSQTTNFLFGICLGPYSMPEQQEDEKSPPWDERYCMRRRISSPRFIRLPLSCNNNRGFVLRSEELETHLVDKQDSKVSICGRVEEVPRPGRTCLIIHGIY